MPATRLTNHLPVAIRIEQNRLNPIDRIGRKNLLYDGPIELRLNVIDFDAAAAWHDGGPNLSAGSRPIA